MPAAHSHSFTDLSALPEARVCPSGVKASAVTRHLWPLSRRITDRQSPVRPRRVGGLAVRQDTERRDTVGVMAENEELVSLTLLPEISPFPAAEIDFRVPICGFRCCLGPVVVEELQGLE